MCTKNSSTSQLKGSTGVGYADSLSLEGTMNPNVVYLSSAAREAELSSLFLQNNLTNSGASEQQDDDDDKYDFMLCTRAVGD